MEDVALGLAQGFSGSGEPQPNRQMLFPDAANQPFWAGESKTSWRRVRNHLKTDVPFPKKRPEHFQDKSLEGAGLWESWHELSLLPPGLDLNRVLESWQETVFRLARSSVEEEAKRARMSCAGLGGLGLLLSEKSRTLCTHSPVAFIQHKSAGSQVSTRCGF